MQSNNRDLQLELERKYNKNQLVTRIRQEFTDCEALDFAAALDDLGVDPNLGINILTQLAIHKRANMATMIGCVRHYADELQDIADTLLIMAENDYINWDPEQELFIVELDVSKDVQEEIDTYQFPLPMIVEPRQVKDNMDTGYLTGNRSIILKNNHHDDDVCLDHINRMNRIAMSIDIDTANMIQNKWKGLDKQKDDETRTDFLRRVKAFKKYDETAHTIMALLVNAGNKFYLTHRPDKRGRTYCQGHHVNYQGNPWNKATVVLAKGEVVEC